MFVGVHSRLGPQRRRTALGTPCYSRRVSGKLFVVATPLGNLEDLSPRALEVLRTADCIACEDTRRTARLLARYEVTTPTLSCHRFNERERLEPILTRLGDGQRIALVSDGGTPGVSDPGALLVAHALERGISVEPVPGPSAVATLLSVSGLPANRYVFEGFLPHRAGERRRRLRELRSEERTLVLFETPHRIRGALEDMRQVLGERPIVLGRELTKQHETLLRGSAAELLEQLGSGVRGEITLAVAGFSGTSSDTEEKSSREVVARWREALAQSDGDARGALKLAARRLGIKRAELHRLLVELGEPTD